MEITESFQRNKLTDKNHSSLYIGYCISSSFFLIVFLLLFLLLTSFFSIFPLVIFCYCIFVYFYPYGLYTNSLKV